jgi:hypothetical protein
MCRLRSNQTMKPSLETRLLWLFRISVFATYVGHGAFGIIGKKAWVAYFGVVGISESWAWKLMPIIGAVDISIGIITLLSPRRAILLYATIWAFWTALLRPLSGEPVWEALERAGNYGVPLAFLLASQARGWFSRLEIRPLDAKLKLKLAWILRATTSALLTGHGALAAVVQKPLLQHHLDALGLKFVPLTALGGFEIALGLAVLLDSAGWLLLFVVVWKIVTESFYPISGAPFWEFIERGGSHIAPLALFFLVYQPLTATAESPARPSPLTGAELLQKT